jgi:hypothetical protein
MGVIYSIVDIDVKFDNNVKDPACKERKRPAWVRSNPT